MTTPVEVWAPAFAGVLKEITPEAIFEDVEDWRVPLKRWCRLCETHVSFGELQTHADEHERERAEFGRKRTDRAPGDGLGEVPSPGGRPSRPRREVNHMATATKKRAALSEQKEKALNVMVEKTFESRSEDFRKGAVIYGRKLLKFDAGMRTSRPPVPPALQSGDREKTRKTCVEVAEALGLDPAKLGLSEEASLSEDLASEASEKKEEAKQPAAESNGKSKAKSDPKPSAKKKKAATATS